VEGSHHLRSASAKFDLEVEWPVAVVRYRITSGAVAPGRPCWKDVMMESNCAWVRTSYTALSVEETKGLASEAALICVIEAAQMEN
jgi:hypothetical protein